MEKIARSLIGIVSIVLSGLVLQKFALLDPRVPMPWCTLGVLLALLLLWSYKSLPTIWLGLFLLKILADYLRPESTTALYSLLTAVLVATLGTLNSAFGYWLFKKLAGEEPKLEQETDIFKFILAVLPTSLIYALVVAAASYFAPDFTPTGTLSLFAVAWATCMLSILLIAPFTWSMVNSDFLKNTKARLLIGAPLALVLVASFFFYRGITTWESQRDLEALQDQSKSIAQSIQSSLSLAEHDLYSMRAFYKSSKFVDHGEFKIFSQDSLPKGRIESLLWAPLVEQAGRAAFEAHPPDDLSPVELFELDPTGGRIASPVSKYYAPVIYFESVTPLQHAYGHNLLNYKDRGEAILQAIQSNRLTMTPSVENLFEPKSKNLALIILPIYKNDKPIDTVEQRLKNSDGVILARLNIESVVNQALSEEINSPFEVSITDVSNEKTPPLHFW